MQASSAPRADRSTAPATGGGVIDLDRVPSWIRDAMSLPTISYADELTVETSEKASPEQWARAMFGDTPILGEIVIWRGLLGLRLAKGASPSTVAGWRIGASGDDWIRLEAASWFLSANILVRRQDRQVSLSTVLRYDRLLAKIAWPILSKVHLMLVPRVLAKAVSVVADSNR